MKRNKRVAFIEPGAPGKHIYSAFGMPRIGAVLLATILKSMGFEVRVFVEDIKSIDREARKWIEESKIVCVSTITSTATRAYALADYWRDHGKVVILGGVHPTFMSEEAINHADYVVRGEGEESFPALIQYLFDDIGTIEEIRGVSYVKDGSVVHN